MKTAVFAFGRMNPPTIGHGKLVDKVKAVARSNRGDALIYLSHTHNDDKDPLPYDKKIKHAQSAFGRKIVKKSNSTTVIKVVKEIEKMGYDEVIMVAGSDRVDEFKRLLTKYNGPGKDWNFKKVSVVSAGQRDPDAEGAAGMSATKVRAAAKAKDFNTFKQGVAKGVNVTSLYKDLSEETGMQDIVDDWEPTEQEIDNYIIFEENDFDDDEWIELDERVLTIMQRLQRGRLMRRKAPIMKRMRKVKARRMAPRSRLAYRARKAAIGLLRKRFGGHKGANYANLSISQKIQIDRQIERRKSLIGKISKRMLPKVRKKEVARLRQVRSGGVKREAVQMDINKEIEQLFEVNYRVEVPGLPTMYVHGKSPAEVRRKLRDTVKPGMIKDIQINRVVDADVKKAFRLKAQGKEKVDDKDSRGAVDEELESFLESVSDNPKYQMKPRGPNAPSWVTGVKPKIVKKEAANDMDDAHANIYPKRQAIKWKTKPPEGTKHIHPASKWDGMTKDDIKSSWKDGQVGNFHEARRGRPPKNPTGDEDQGGEHIIIQLRKSVSLRGQKHVEFGDGAKHQVPERHAQKALAMHARMKPAQKAHFEKHMSMSHSHYKDAVAGKPLPTKRNPMTNKSDHSWVDHPLGHKWKFDEETKPRIKSFNDMFEAGAIARGKSAIDRMKIPGMFGDQIGGAPAEPKQPKPRPKKKVIDRTKEFQDQDEEIKAKPAIYRVPPGTEYDRRGMPKIKDPDKWLDKGPYKPPPGKIDPDKWIDKKPWRPPAGKIDKDKWIRKLGVKEQDEENRPTGSLRRSSQVPAGDRDKKTREYRPRGWPGKQLKKVTGPHGEGGDPDDTQAPKNVQDDYSPVGDHSSDYKTYKYRDPRTGKFYDKQVKRKLDTWREEAELDEIAPIVAPLVGAAARAALGTVARSAARGIATVAGKTIVLAPVAGLSGSSEDEDIEKEVEIEKKRKRLPGHEFDQTSLQTTRMEAKITEALIRKSVESDFSKEVLYEVYNRGIGEHHDSKKAFDRVNSFINKGKARTLDRDLLGEE